MKKRETGFLASTSETLPERTTLDAGFAFFHGAGQLTLPWGWDKKLSVFSCFLPTTTARQTIFKRNKTASIKETAYIELVSFEVLPIITCDASTSSMKLEA
ncbi:hypothetical protein HPY31_12135 [Brevibacillus sp. HB1.3]|uniref:hypothetical protein n=1 Tax=Brevibacillus sp. HB1.3 TaxID=2738842 RepID=UPI001553FA1F|nr:hypothetical protein [Brevibacillus sp. HB1.3]NQF14660.1 hypothetical protein [Brevibacillus sp. HB1.3]